MSFVDIFSALVLISLDSGFEPPVYLSVVKLAFLCMWDFPRLEPSCL